MVNDIQKSDTIAAHRRAESIRDGLRSFIETRALITEAFESSDWITLGYTSWELYCEKEFAVKQLRLSKEDRIAAAVAFRDSGMTFREIAAATGSSPATAMRDLAPAVSDETKPPLVTALTGAIVSAEENQKKTAAAGGNPAADEASSQSAQTSVDDASAGTGDGANVAGPGKPPTADGPLVSSDGEPATPSTTPPPAAGAGAPPEADRPVPAVNPTDHPASAVPGAAEDSGPTGGPSSAAVGAGTPAVDETGSGSSPREPDEVDREQERDGVSAPAPTPPPSWLVAITNVIHAVDELDKEEPAEVAPLIAADLADELGKAFDQLHAWYLHLRDRTP